MRLRESRQATHDAVLQGVFIKNTLEQSGKELDQDIKKRMGGFNSSFWANRNFSVNGNNTLTYTHLRQHRFVDMKTRETKDGIIRKKRYAIHNKPIFGHLNNIIRQLSFGFTEAVKAEIIQLDGTNI